ncbi:hypothetical protein LV779_07240 [Streptomyces thinghirensis]|nr:hypothetical protein [Streptomyces thinghirensis]
MGAWQRGEILADWPLIGLANPSRSMLPPWTAPSTAGCARWWLKALTVRRVNTCGAGSPNFTDRLLDELPAGRRRRRPQGGLRPPARPMYVIADLMGIEEGAAAAAEVLFEKFFSTGRPAEVVATLTELAGIMADTAAAKRADPGRRPHQRADPGVRERRPPHGRGDRLHAPADGGAAGHEPPSRSS